MTGKADIQAKRNERLAKSNPDRLQKQIDDLKAITEGGGKLSRHEEQVLEGLEKQLKAVKKARDTLGDKAPTFGRGGPREGRTGVLGKRTRDGDGGGGSSSDEDVPEDVRRIPMPRDTPPPFPKEVLDRWHAKRRAAWQARQGERGGDGDEKDESSRTPAPQVEVKTVYEAKPVVRDLQKEAVAAFVPTAVRVKMDKAQGRGGLIEPEEADRLEREGYLAGSAQTPAEAGPRGVTLEEVEDEDD